MIKTTTLFAVAASVAVLSGSEVHAMESFLAKIPNGSLFGKWLGHTEDGYTAFGNDFSSEFEWTERLCKLNFAGAATKMTYGEAFGDPCCTWKVGAKPQTITAWAQGGAPSKATVCAATTPTVTSAAPAATTAKPAAATTTKPAATTAKPAAATTTKPTASTTKAPASNATPKPSSKKCTKKAKRN